MNAAQPSHDPRLSSLLMQREVQLRSMLDSAGAAVLRDASDGSEVTDFKDLAASEAVNAVEDLQAEHAAEQLSQVLAARRRLEDGTYGNCADCGDAIDERRLLAMPETPLCASCQSQRERATQVRHPHHP